MDNQIKTYYIPNNSNIAKGTIYTLYKNNINNLNLESILYHSTSHNQEAYNKLLELTNLSTNIINERNKNIQKFINEENNTINKLFQINKEKQELVKKLTKGKEV